MKVKCYESESRPCLHVKQDKKCSNQPKFIEINQSVGDRMIESVPLPCNMLRQVCLLLFIIYRRGLLCGPLHASILNHDLHNLTSPCVYCVQSQSVGV